MADRNWVLNSIVPLGLAQEFEAPAAAATWTLNSIVPLSLSMTFTAQGPEWSATYWGPFYIAFNGAEAAGPVTATMTATIAPAALTSTAQLAVQANLTATLAAATLSSSAALAIQASTTATLAAATLSSAAVLPILADSAKTLAAATLDSTASLSGGINADVDSTLAAATLDSTASVTDAIVPVIQESLGPNQHRWFRGRLVTSEAEIRRELRRPRRRPEEQRAIERPAPAPELTSIRDDVEREIAYLLRKDAADALADSERAKAIAGLERQFAQAAELARRDEEEELAAILVAVALYDEAA